MYNATSQILPKQQRGNYFPKKGTLNNLNKQNVFNPIKINDVVIQNHHTQVADI